MELRKEGTVLPPALHLLVSARPPRVTVRRPAVSALHLAALHLVASVRLPVALVHLPVASSIPAVSVLHPAALRRAVSVHPSQVPSGHLLVPDSRTGVPVVRLPAVRLKVMASLKAAMARPAQRQRPPAMVRRLLLARRIRLSGPCQARLRSFVPVAPPGRSVRSETR
jgi:hypothetical protein